MAVFSTGGIGIDPGSVNLTICLENEGVVLREPGLVLALRSDIEDVLAVGRDARQMMGRTPHDVVLISPVTDGAVADTNLTTLLMQSLTEKALGKKRPLERNRLAVTISQGATRVEREALETAVLNAGARRAYLLRTTAAAAIGAGLDFEQPKGVMAVVIGGAMTEIAVLASDSIAAARTVRTGGMAFDEAIIRYLRREKGIIIGQRTAEDLKQDIGSALPVESDKDEEVLLRGRDALSGKPTQVRIHASDIQKAIEAPVQDLTETIREAFENTPAELAADIADRGILLSGGGALLTGLRERLEKLLGVPVTCGAEPQDDVAQGLCRAASDERLARRMINSGCMTEV